MLLIILYNLTYSHPETGEQKTHYGFRFIKEPRHFKLESSKLTTEFQSQKLENSKEIGLTLKISAESLAVYVYLESDLYDFVASDNFISLYPGEQREISIRSFTPHLKDATISKEEFIKSLKIKSLYDLR